MANALLDKLKKVSANKIKSKTLADTDFFNSKKYGAAFDTHLFNLAVSGKFKDGGVTPGVTVLAGPSRSLKTVFGIYGVKAFLDKFEEGICLFYDSEFGGPGYWETAGVDMDRVLHIPIKNIEDLKFDVQNKLNELTDKDKVIIFIDSIGMLASKKEANDALEENSAADMTRAKEIKSFFRIVTPTLNQYHIPLLAINSVHASFDKYAPVAMGGGTGILLAANTVLFFAKSKLKDERSDKEKKADTSGRTTDDGRFGNKFRITIEKSRFIKEGSKFEFEVVYGERGPNRYTGLYEMALKTGDIYSPSNGWRAARTIDKDGNILPEDQHPKFREKDKRLDPDFWEKTMFKQTNFAQNVENRISLQFVGGDAADFTDDADNASYIPPDDDLPPHDPVTGELED
ncbi:RecA-like recombination protein [Agrobacterium phage OLIVR5]|uniref:RecA-like recombination protein n=1 Tax=Agrobacterium phage OLIVR5 TaxID=2723773 RepID=A0A858MTG0_9CAUD|nr:DNA repair protein [Agrobacterium phage OLIVR5]QIW87879.1 RecA-like recombination protein [Agrobacterium phage OLIVR5]QIW88144.1 RecA-like recombination protein [Agrobacterium phage OLIVR6]